MHARTRLLSGLLSTALVLPLLVTPTTVRAAGPASGASAPPGTTETVVGRRVDVRDVAGRSGPTRTRVHETLPAPKGVLDTTADRVTASGIRRVERSLGTSALLAAPTPQLAQTQSGFEGVSEAVVSAKLGLSCSTPPCIEPPDPWIGVGPAHVVQAVNTVIRITDRNGAPAVADVDFATFFGEPPDQVADADPRVVYDDVHDRWIATALSFDCTAGHLYLAVSTTTDPTGAWYVSELTFPGTIPDYPGLGTSADKIALAVNEFAIVPAGSSCDGGTFLGATVVSVDSAEAIAGPTIHPTRFGPDTDRFTWRPALAVGTAASADLPLIAVDASDDGIRYARLTGTYTTGDLALADQRNLNDVGATPFVGTIPPSQPGGTIANAVDGRPTDAISRDGRTYLVSTVTCGDYDCVRVTVLDSTTGDPAYDFAYFISGYDLYHGGIGLSNDGTLHVVFTASNEWRSPGSWSFYWKIALDPIETASDANLLKAGAAPYGGNRWGDYVGVATDPNDSSAVWQANQYPTANHSWATWVSQLRVSSIGTNGQVTRVFGPDRYATAAATSASVFAPGVAVAYVATGANFPDALAGGPAAALEGGPVLLVTRDTVPGVTATELARLHPRRIVVLGSASVVSEAVKASLKAYTAGTVSRLAGPDRYATAAAVSAAVFKSGVAVAYVATGGNFPDALAGGPAAALWDGPMLLVGKTSIPTATANELIRLQPQYIVVLGSTSVISASVQASLATYTALGTSDFVYRLFGADRYATAAAITSDTFTPGVAVAYVATGTNFPDALAGGPAAALEDGPVMLVTRDAIPAATASELTRLKPKRIVVLGSTVVVSDAVKNSLAAYVVP